MYLFGKYQSKRICTNNFIDKDFNNNKTHCLPYISTYWSTKTCMGILMALRVCHTDFPSGEKVLRGVYLTALAARPLRDPLQHAFQHRASDWTQQPFYRAIPAQWTLTIFVLVEIFSKLHCSLTLLDPIISNPSFSVFHHRYHTCIPSEGFCCLTFFLFSLSFLGVYLYWFPAHLLLPWHLLLGGSTPSQEQHKQTPN